MTWPTKSKEEKYAEIARTCLEGFKFGDLVKITNPTFHPLAESGLPRGAWPCTDGQAGRVGIVLAHSGQGHLWEALLDILVEGEVRTISARRCKNISRKHED